MGVAIALRSLLLASGTSCGHGAVCRVSGSEEEFLSWEIFLPAGANDVQPFASYPMAYPP